MEGLFIPEWVPYNEWIVGVRLSTELLNPFQLFPSCSNNYPSTNSWNILPLVLIGSTESPHVSTICQHVSAAGTTATELSFWAYKQHEFLNELCTEVLTWHYTCLTLWNWRWVSSHESIRTAETILMALCDSLGERFQERRCIFLLLKVVQRRRKTDAWKPNCIHFPVCPPTDQNRPDAFSLFLWTHFPICSSPWPVISIGEQVIKQVKGGWNIQRVTQPSSMCDRKAEPKCSQGLLWVSKAVEWGCQGRRHTRRKCSDGFYSCSHH